jgi:hypothetical protein
MKKAERKMKAKMKKEKLKVDSRIGHEDDDVKGVLIFIQ